MNTIVLNDKSIIENVDSVEERYVTGEVKELVITVFGVAIEDLATKLNNENVSEIIVKDEEGNVVDTFSYHTLTRLSKYIRGAEVRINATLV